MQIRIRECICNSCSVPFNGRRALVEVMKKISEKAADVPKRGIPEVHLLFHELS